MKQRAVIEFLVAEALDYSNVRNSSKHSQTTAKRQINYHDEALDYSNVRRWACRLAEDSDESQQSGHASLKDLNKMFISSKLFVSYMSPFHVC